MRILAAALALALLGACSTLFDSKTDYKKAGKAAPLEVPPDLTAPTSDGRYQVPADGRGTATLSDYQAGRAQQPGPGGASLLPVIAGMRIERAGNERWLVVNEPPERLWPRVKAFWQDNGFAIELELPEAGVLETDWVENRPKVPESWLRRMLGSLVEGERVSAEFHKYRTRLERAPDGGTEVYISQRAVAEEYVDRDASAEPRPSEGPVKSLWQARPPDPELEIEFLSRLMAHIGAPQGQAKAQVAGAPQQRAMLSKTIDGAQLLELTEPFDRAWRRVGLALDRIGFTVEDRDRQKGVYFVRYADPEGGSAANKDPGLLGRLAFWRDEKPKVTAEQYRVSVTAADRSSRVQVLDKDGATENSPTAGRILALLLEQLK